MRTHILLLSLVIVSCHKDKDPCDSLINGVYHTPEVPANHHMTIDEVDAYVDLPQDIAECITTEGLIESILEYRYIGLIDAGLTPQHGYELVKSKYRGLSELESRTDRGKRLLEKYLSRDPLNFDRSWDLVETGRYILTGNYLELILGQYTNLQNLDASEFKTMFLRSLEVYHLKKTEADYFDYYSMMYPLATLARMMKIKNYAPFISLYNTNEIVLNITELYSPSHPPTLEQILEIAEEYSTEL